MKEKNVNDNDNDSENEEKIKDEKRDDLVYEYDLQYLSGIREGLLAKEIAEGLNDMKSIRYYFSISLEYSERYIREIYRKVRETPEHKIKKSRGALFTYLIRKYEHRDTDD